jgi:hypothetical protein
LSFLNQAFKIYSLIYPGPKLSGGSHEKEFAEGANIEGVREFCISLEAFLFHLSPGRGGKDMKKMLFWGCLVLFLAPVVWAQEKVEAPVWNEGDKWVFTGDNSIEVVKADQNEGILTFSRGICIIETQGFDTIIFHKPSLNRVYVLKGDKRTNYTRAYKKLFNFPFSTGKKWKDTYSSEALFGPQISRFSGDYSENSLVLGWEDVKVRAGKFKALKLEYKRILTDSSIRWATIGEEIKNEYWYSPDAKYFVKCQYDKSWGEGFREIFDWELISFQLKK